MPDGFCHYFIQLLLSHPIPINLSLTTVLYCTMCSTDTQFTLPHAPNYWPPWPVTIFRYTPSKYPSLYTLTAGNLLQKTCSYQRHLTVWQQCCCRLKPSGMLCHVKRYIQTFRRIVLPPFSGPSNLKNVERQTSNMRALRSFETSATMCKPTRRKAVLRQLRRLTNTTYTYWSLLSVSHWLSVIVTKGREITVTLPLRSRLVAWQGDKWRVCVCVCVWAMITDYLSARRLNHLCQTQENAVTMCRETFATCNQVRPFV